MAKERREGRPEALRVAVRCCPGRDKDAVVKQDGNSFQLQRPKTTLKKSFKFEKVWPSETDTGAICDDFASPAIRAAVAQGETLGMLSFGAAKTGKTATMRGPEGVMRRAAGEVLRAAEGLRAGGAEAMVSVSALMSVVTAPAESHLTGRLVTHEVLLDALLPDGGDAAYRGGLVVREHPSRGFFVEGLTEVCVEGEADCAHWAGRALANFDAEEARCGSPGGPLRVHCMLTLRTWVRQTDGSEVVSDVQLVDLAGWQRPEKAASSRNLKDKEKRAPAYEDIVVKAVMRVTDSLEQRASHIPYRDAKLTRLLQRPLGMGGACMVLLHVGLDTYEETEAMLQYGQRLAQVELRVARTAVDYFAQQERRAARIRELCATLNKDPAGLKSTSLALNLGSADEEVELRDCVAACERLAEEAAAWERVKFRSDAFRADGGEPVERLDRKAPKAKVEVVGEDKVPEARAAPPAERPAPSQGGGGGGRGGSGSRWGTSGASWRNCSSARPQAPASGPCRRRAACAAGPGARSCSGAGPRGRAKMQAHSCSRAGLQGHVAGVRHARLGLERAAAAA